MTQRVVAIDVDPAPKPPEDDTNLGMFVLTTINVLAALFLLVNSVRPAIWGEVIAGFQLEWTKWSLTEVGQRSAIMFESERRFEDLQKAKEKYDRFRWLHWIVAAASLAPVVGLLKISLGTYLGDFELRVTTIWLVMTFVLIGINLILGWGETGAVVVMAIVGIEAVLLHIPVVQRYLSGMPTSAVMEGPADKTAKKKKKSKETPMDAADSKIASARSEARPVDPMDEDYSY